HLGPCRGEQKSPCRFLPCSLLAPHFSPLGGGGGMNTLVSPAREETEGNAERTGTGVEPQSVKPRGAPRSRALALLSISDQALVSGASFATSVIIGRTCSKEDLGVYSLALSLVLFIRGIQGELVCSPYAIFSSRREGRDLAAYTGSTLVHYLSLTV